MRGLSLFRRFLGDRRGNIAILFGLCLIPLTGAIAVAVDYSFANQARTRMQAALDMTALTLSKMMPLNDADLQTKGRQIFLANLGKTPLTLNETNVGDQLTITSGPGNLALEVNTEYPIKMAGVLSPLMPDDLPIAAHTEVVWGQGKVEVALALDNTTSMLQSGKMTQLIAAANNLIEILKNAARNDGDAKVAIVPFAVQIKVDKNTYVGANWIRWDLWEATNGTCNGRTGKTQDSCGSCSVSGVNSASSCASAGRCSLRGQNTQTGCQNWGGTWTPATWTPGNWVPANHSTWNGCIEDRDKDPSVDYDVNDHAVNTDVANDPTQFPAAQECGGLVTAMPLNYNWGNANSIDPTTLHGKINTMTAAGNTNVTIGLNWAFQMLSPAGALPLAQGAAYGTENLTKYLIILTDGDNTQNRWTSTQSQIDARTSAACDAIKTRDIKIYSIRVMDGNETLLRNCASDPSMYFSVTDASQLQGVFNTIGTTIANLHLSR